MEKRQSNSVKVVFAWAIVFVMLVPAFAQRDPGVGGGIQNTGGGLQQQGIPIPHPPLISARKGTSLTRNNQGELTSKLLWCACIPAKRASHTIPRH